MRPKWWQRPLIWLLLATLFKQVVWSGVVPLWHFPDEQAHFAQVQNQIEAFSGSEGTTSQEIYQSEILLGTDRDERGNNRFTFHPEYNLNYTHSFTGETELKIKNLSKESRQQRVISEATSYPFLYYFLGGLVYRLVYPTNLFVRVFSIRLLSALITVAAVGVVYKIGELVFKNRFWALTLGILVSFQPMFSFVGSGVNSDVLFNFFFTFFIWASLLVWERASWPRLLLVLISLAGGIATKQQMMIAFGLALGPSAWGLWQLLKKKRLVSLKYLGLLVVALEIVALGIKKGEVYRIAGYIDAGQDSSLASLGLFAHFKWSVQHLIAEVLPWYWGVFKWLGVVLPRWVNRVQMRLLLVSGVGLVIWLFKLVWKKQFNKQNWYVIWLTIVAGVYFLAVTLWDWQFRKAYGFSFGVQGRYFFPAIVAHMALLMVGLRELCSVFTRIFNFQFSIFKWALLVLNSWWVILLGIGLYTVLTAYYDLWPLQKVWWQVSQYKPFWFKAEWWFLWPGLYLISLFGLIISSAGRGLAELAEENKSL